MLARRHDAGLAVHRPDDAIGLRRSQSRTILRFWSVSSQQREAAALANIPPEQWNTYERRRHLPDAYNLDRIARAFSVSIEELTRVGTEGEQRWRERRRWNSLRAAINRVRALGENDFSNFVAIVAALADVLERRHTQGE